MEKDDEVSRATKSKLPDGTKKLDIETASVTSFLRVVAQHTANDPSYYGPSSHLISQLLPVSDLISTASILPMATLTAPARPLRPKLTHYLDEARTRAPPLVIAPVVTAEGAPAPTAEEIARAAALASTAIADRDAAIRAEAQEAFDLALENYTDFDLPTYKKADDRYFKEVEKRTKQSNNLYYLIMMNLTKASIDRIRNELYCQLRRSGWPR